jgi:hypothetical protein
MPHTDDNLETIVLEGLIQDGEDLFNRQLLDEDTFSELAAWKRRTKAHRQGDRLARIAENDRSRSEVSHTHVGPHPELKLARVFHRFGIGNVRTPGGDARARGLTYPAQAVD